MVESQSADAGRQAELSRTFAALADPTRRAVLMRLAADGEASVSELAAPYPVSLNAISKHLKVLEGAGLIRREVRGRQHFCRLNTAPLASASGWADRCRRFWEERLDALELFLDSRREP